MEANSTLFSCAFLLLIAAAGMVYGVPIAWKLSGFTLALAFFSQQANTLGRVDVANFLALGSWVTGAAAGLSVVTVG